MVIIHFLSEKWKQYSLIISHFPIFVTLFHLCFLKYNQIQFYFIFLNTQNNFMISRLILHDNFISNSFVFISFPFLLPLWAILSCVLSLLCLQKAVLSFKKHQEFHISAIDNFKVLIMLKVISLKIKLQKNTIVTI